MGVQEHQKTLRDIPANRQLINALCYKGVISRQTRQTALSVIHPYKQWEHWISRGLLSVGAALVLSGIIYFFAFNWNRIAPMVKLFSIEAAIIGCVAGSLYVSLSRTGGKMLLLSASVLTGVFLAVFGQIYQTGADAWQLFAMWSLLIAGWTVCCRFAAGWAVWLTVSNTVLITWWQQAANPSDDMTYGIFLLLAALNGAALMAREYGAHHRGYAWLSHEWSRIALLIVVLCVLLPSAIIWLAVPIKATTSMVISGIIGVLGHCLLYYWYRYRMPDIWALALVTLSLCLLTEAVTFRVLLEFYMLGKAMHLLLMSVFTLGIFTKAIVSLRRIALTMEAQHAA